MKFCLESIFSVFIDSGLLIFLFYEQFCLIRDQYQSISISVLMLYYSFLYEMYHRPYILEFYIIDSFFFFSLALTLSVIHILYFYCFTTSNQFGFFSQNRFQLLQWYDRYIISRLVLYIQIMRNDELVISSYYRLVYFFFWIEPYLKKANESHTKHSNYIKSTD